MLLFVERHVIMAMCHSLIMVQSGLKLEDDENFSSERCTFYYWSERDYE